MEQQEQQAESSNPNQSMYDDEDLEELLRERRAELQVMRDNWKSHWLEQEASDKDPPTVRKLKNSYEIPFRTARWQYWV